METITDTQKLEAVKADGRLYGYARVSTGDQDPQLQIDALIRSGVQKRDIKTDHGQSGAKASRPAWDELRNILEPGDVLVVWKLDRAGRSVKHLVDLVEDLRERGIGFKSVTEGIDTTTPGGRLVFHIFAAMAEFERDLIGERTDAGLAAARAQGKVGGRKKTITTRTSNRIASMHRHGAPKTEIAETVGVSRSTVYRVLQEAGLA